MFWAKASRELLLDPEKDGASCGLRWIAEACDYAIRGSGRIYVHNRHSPSCPGDGGQVADIQHIDGVEISLKAHAVAKERDNFAAKQVRVA